MVLPAFRAIRSRVGWRDPVDNAAKVVHRFKLIACIVIWFGSSAVSTACAKVALSMLAPKAGSCALTITSVQFTAAALAAVAACVLLRRRPLPAARELVFVSIAYTLGFLFLNQSLGRLAASFTETVRGLEPLTSFALAWLLGARGSQLVPVTATALGVVLCGAALSVWAQPNFDVGGLLLGLLANTAFSARSLLVTLLQDAQRKLGGEIDSVSLFAAQHVLGLMLLAPAAYADEGAVCLTELGERWPALRAALLSALGFVSYNFLSLYVLLLLDIVSHSVCNTARRAVTIIAALLIFATPISVPSALGIVLIIGGSVAYAMGKEAPARARPERLLSFSESDVEGEPTEQAHLNPDDLHGLPPTVARNVACGDNLSATSGKADNPRCTSRT